MIKGRLPRIRRGIPHGVQAVVVVAAAANATAGGAEEHETKAPGGDGEVEGRALC